MSKRIILVLLAVLFIAGIAFAETPGYRLSPGRGEIIQMPFQSDPPKKFRMVRYIGGLTASTLAADSIVVWDTVTDDGVTVNTTTQSGDSSVAGILVQAIMTQDTTSNTAVQDIGKDNWSWLQTYGLSQVDMSGTTTVLAGSAMGTSGTAGKATMFMPSTTNSLAQGNAGFFLDAAAASSTDVECFVRTD